MLKRIPHTDLIAITGEKKTRDYLRMQKMMGKFYLKDFFSRFGKINNGGRYLEVGPGPGYQTVLVARKYDPEEIIGLEFSPDMVDVATKYIKREGFSDKIRYVNGSVEDSGLVQSLGKFDLIYSTFSLHHWTDPEKGIKNLFDALSDEGVMFIYDFHRGGLLYHLNLKRGVWESIRASYTQEDIIKMLKDPGIEDYIIRRKSIYMDLIVFK